MTSNWLLFIAVAVIEILPLRADARDQCVAKVVQAESLPFDREGSWLTTAKRGASSRCAGFRHDTSWGSTVGIGYSAE